LQSAAFPGRLPYCPADHTWLGEAPCQRRNSSDVRKLHPGGDDGGRKSDLRIGVRVFVYGN